MKKKIFILFMIVVSLFALTACKKAKKETKKKEPNTAEEVKLEDIDEGFDMYSDDTKIVFQNGGNLLVYYYSGDDITAYHNYIYFGDEATANSVFETFQKDDTMDNIYVKGPYMVIEYNESQYYSLKVSTIRDFYSNLREVVKEG